MFHRKGAGTKLILFQQSYILLYSQHVGIIISVSNE